MFRRFVIAVGVNIAALFVASVFIDGIDYARKFWVLILAGVVFALVNMLIKPIVKLLALPVTIATLGLALFFINLLMLYITSWIVGPFKISSFGDAIFATLIIWIVNQVLYAWIEHGERDKQK